MAMNAGLKAYQAKKKGKNPAKAAVASMKKGKKCPTCGMTMK